MNPADDSRGRAIPLPLCFLILIASVFAIYGRTIRFDFTSWDDYETIARNPRLHPPAPQSLADFWTRPQMDLYIPVTYTLWALTANVSQDPGAFHALNVLLHAGSACVAFLLLRRLINDRVAALIGACAFALHPLQVESVAWVSGTKDVLCGLLSLIAIWQYAIYAQADRSGELLRSDRIRLLSIATIAFILAMLAKPTAIVIPLIAAVLDLIVGRPPRKVATILVPWFLLVIPTIVITHLSQPAAHAHAAATAISRRPLIAADAIAFYLYKLAWPAKLTFDYGRTPDVIFARGWGYGTWIVPALVATIIWLSRKKSPLFAAAGLIFLIALLPTLGFVPFDFQAYSTVADHYVYLAMLAPAIVVAFASTFQRARAPAIVLLIVLASRAFFQTSTWTNSRSLFEHALSINPSSFASYNSLAAAAAEARDPDTAARFSRRAIELRPSYAGGYLTYADAMRQKGDLAAAATALKQALQYEPDYPAALHNLAAIHAQQGDLPRAIETAKRELAVAPGSVEGHLNLARMYVQSGNSAQARRELQATLQLDPQNQPARELLQAVQP